jgi:two-component system LytT family response regulator
MQTTLRVRHSQTHLPATSLAAIKSLESLRRIAVKTQDAVYLIKVDEIVRCVADSNYCHIHYGAGLKVMVAKTLKAVAALLPASKFVRVHQSHIICVEAIHLVYQDHVILDNGDSIPLSRNCRPVLMQHLDEFAKCL